MNQIIEILCPSCSKDKTVRYEILKSGQNPVVKCTECKYIQSLKIEAQKQVQVRVIISKDKNSYRYKQEMDENEIIYIDDELIIEDKTKEEVFPIIVTSIESDGRRVEYSKSKDIDTLWGRAIDEVSLRFAIHSRAKTISVIKKIKGDYLFTVGDLFSLDNKEVVITHIKIRNGNFKSRKGDRMEAKYIKQMFAKEIRRGETEWSKKI